MYYPQHCAQEPQPAFRRQRRLRTLNSKSVLNVQSDSDPAQIEAEAVQGDAEGFGSKELGRAAAGSSVVGLGI
jgi:hypothetical protein